MLVCLGLEGTTRLLGLPHGLVVYPFKFSYQKLCESLRIRR